MLASSVGSEVLLSPSRVRMVHCVQHHLLYRLRPFQILYATLARTVHYRSYLPNWSDEIFTIKSVHRTRPPVYRLVDEHGGTLDGTFYEPELQKVLISSEIQLLMNWWGYPTSFNSWIDERALVKYKG